MKTNLTHVPTKYREIDMAFFSLTVTQTHGGLFFSMMVHQAEPATNSVHCVNRSKTASLYSECTKAVLSRRMNTFQLGRNIFLFLGRAVNWLHRYPITKLLNCIQRHQKQNPNPKSKVSIFSLNIIIQFDSNIFLRQSRSTESFHFPERLLVSNFIEEVTESRLKIRFGIKYLTLIFMLNMDHCMPLFCFKANVCRNERCLRFVAFSFRV